MSENALVEIKKLINEDTPAETIVEVLKFDRLTGKGEYRRRGGVSEFVSQTAYSPGDNLVISGDNVIGLAEPLTNTVWID